MYKVSFFRTMRSKGQYSVNQMTKIFATCTLSLKKVLSMTVKNAFAGVQLCQYISKCAYV
jgi:hypothetical protein